MKPLIGILAVVALIALGWYFLADNSGEDTAPVEEGANAEEDLGVVEDEGPISAEPTLVYAGTVPAASGPGIETELTLTDRGDGQGGGFTLVETYLEEENGTFETTGQWNIQTGVIEEDPESPVIVLTSEENPDFETRYYELTDDNTIRQLDTEGARIESDLPYELELQ